VKRRRFVVVLRDMGTPDVGGGGVRFQLEQDRQVRRVAREQVRSAQEASIAPLGVGAHPEQASDLAGASAPAMETNEILKPVHAEPGYRQQDRFRRMRLS